MSESAKPLRQAQLIPHEEMAARWRQRPGYQAAFDTLEEEFSIMSALIKARTDAGLTQAEVAKHMQTTQSAVARLEGGGRLPPTRTLQRYAAATGHRLKITLEPIAPKTTVVPTDVALTKVGV